MTDAAGEQATGQIDVTVHDDGPALTGVVDATDPNALLNENPGPLVVSLNGFHTGADMVNGEQLSTVTVQVVDGKGGTATYTYTVTWSDKAGYTFTPAEGQDASLTIRSDGNGGYELAYTRPEGDVQSSGTPSYTFTVTVTDADGDSVTEKTTVTTKDRPDISFGENEGTVKEAGVEGCANPAESTNPGDPNASVSGESSASGSIILTDTDSGELTLNLEGTVQHTDAHASGLPTPSVSGWSGTSLKISTNQGDTLTLYLNAEGELVSTQPPDGKYYGTLTLDFSKGKEKGEWTFELADNALVNSLNEGERFDISLKLTATDGTYTSGNAELTVTIEGTNDRPVFTTTANGVGDIEVTDSKNGEQSGPGVEGASSTISGTLTATDADADNGEGSASENGLTFTVTGLTGTDAGTVTADGYTSYGSDSTDYDNLVSSWNEEVASGSDEGGSYTQVTTTYGTLKVYADGTYTYEANDTEQIGGDEYVTETFTVKVQDAHGAWNTQTITITLRDEDNGITGGADLSQNLREEGVAGDAFEGTPPNTHIPTSNGAAAPNNVLFTDADVNDTVTLSFSKAAITLPGASTAITGAGTESTITVGAFRSSPTTLYLVATDNGDGTWSFSWAEANDDPGSNVVGELVLSRGENGEVTYSFTLDPKNTSPYITTDNNPFLDQLAQGDTVNIALTFTPSGADGTADKDASSNLTLTITGTNDKPLIDSVVKVESGGTETAVSDDTQGRSDVTLAPTERYPDTPSGDTSGDGSSGTTSSPDFTGRVVAHDVDSDNGAGSTAGEGAADNHLSFTVTNTPSGSTVTGSTTTEEGTLTTIKTDYGTLTINQNTGEFTYTMDDPALDDKGEPNAIMELGKGQSVTESFTVRVTDAHGSFSEKVITFTITGTNDRPILTEDTLEVHAAEEAVPDANYHEGETPSDHSTDQVEGRDPDNGDSVTYCFAANEDAVAEGQSQSVAITAQNLLDAIDKNAINSNDGAKFTSSGAAEAADTLAVLKAWLTANPNETVATLNITADGKISLELNQNSAFIDALNGEDSFTFDLSDVSGYQVFAKDKSGLLSEASNDVTLVIHGKNDDYTVTAASSLQVKESGVYKGTDEFGKVSGNNSTTPTENHPAGTGYGQEKEAATGIFTISGRDAGQVVFKVKDADGNVVGTYEESSTNIGGSKVNFGDTSGTPSGDAAPSVFYVAGDYGYYEISLDSTMDANGTRTFSYEYHLYSDSTLGAVKELCIDTEGANNFEDRLEAVNALPQGENVQDSVTIGVTIGNSSANDLNLSAQVSGTNDRPVIDGVLEVTDAGQNVVALDASSSLGSLHGSTESGMFFKAVSEDTGGPVLHIQASCGEGNTFVGVIDGSDPDTGGTIANYSFVIEGGSTQVWRLEDNGQTAISDYGYITIDSKGKFTLHINQDAVKSLGEDEKLNLFEGLYVQCTDDLGATSQTVKLHGTLLGRDDAASTTVVNPGMWESGQSAHDDSVTPENPFQPGAGLVENQYSQLKGSVSVTDPDTTDTIIGKVTVTVNGKDYVLDFSNGQPQTVDGEHGEFTFTFQPGENGNEATLHYTYSVNEDAPVRDIIDGLNDGETYKGLENIKVSFTSKPQNGGAERPAGPVATITVDVHGANDAPVITEVKVNGGTTTQVGDTTVINGGTLGYQESAKGTIAVTDPDDDMAVRPSGEGGTTGEGGSTEGGTTGGTTGDGAGASGEGSTGGQLLQFGFLVYHDKASNTDVLVYGKTGTDGRTKYFRADGTPLDITLADLTFSQQVDLEHGTIYVNDYGEYTYSRNPGESWGEEEGDKYDSVYVTVKDPQGAMDSVKIDFTLKPASGGGHLPDVSIDNVTLPAITEPSPDGGQVVAGEASGVASSFHDGAVGNMKLTVSCYKDETGEYIPVYMGRDGKYYIAGTDSPVPSGSAVTTLTGTLVSDGNGYTWQYVDSTGKPVTGFEPSLDFRLAVLDSEGNVTGTTYSLSTDYGTVYVDKDTGELRFELDSRADALNAGETWQGSVTLWVNGQTQTVDLNVTGTGDPSEVTASDVTADLDNAGQDDNEVTSSKGTLTITDIDNSDGAGLSGATDTHTLTINNVQMKAADGSVITGSVTVNGTENDPTVIYVVKVITAEGKSGYVLTTTPSDATRDTYYGELAVWKESKESDDEYSYNEYSYNFTAWADTEAGKTIKPDDKLHFTFGVTVTDTSSTGGTTTTTEGSFTVTVVGRADAVAVTDGVEHINEEGVPGTEDNAGNVSFPGTASGALSVSGSVLDEDFDGNGFTVSGTKGDVDFFETGSTVVTGDYGTLILNSDGSYTYVLDYDKSQSLAEGTIVEDTFTVKVHNAGGDSYATVTVNVHGVNDAPVVTVTPALSVQEGLPDDAAGNPNPGGMATGKVDAQDVDTLGPVNDDGTMGAGDTLSYGIMVGDDFVDAKPGAEGAPATPATVYVVGTWGEDGKLTLTTTTTDPGDQSLVGTLTMDASGNYTFTVADTDTSRALNGGESVKINVNVGASDGHTIVTRPVTITIHGTNKAPEVDASLAASESTVTDVTASDNTYSVTFTPDGPAEGGDGYTVTDADRGDTSLSYTFEQGGRYFTSCETTVTLDGKSYDVTLSVDAEGRITLSYGEDFRNAVNALGKDQTVTLENLGGVNLVVQDNFGGKTETELSLTLTGENDKVVISDVGSIQIVDSDTGNLSGTGSFTFTDADATDTHDVTLPEEVKVTLPGEENPVAATVSVGADGKGKVTLSDGTVLGTLTANLEKDSTGGNTVSYTFEADDTYLSGLGQGESATISVNLTVTEKQGETAVNTETQTITVTLTGQDDATVITKGEGNTFTLSDADKTDTIGTPSITGVVAEGTGLLQGASFSVTDGSVTATFQNTLGNPVTVTLGLLTLAENADGSWTYAFTPDENAAKFLPAGSSVSISGVTVAVTTTHKDGSTTTTNDVPLTATLPDIVGTNAMEGYAPESSLTAQGAVTSASSFTLAALVASGDGDSDPLTYTWSPDSELVSLNANGTFTLTEAGLLAFARSIANGEDFTLDFSYTVTDGLNTAQDSFTLTLDGSSVTSVETGDGTWYFGTGERDAITGGTTDDFIFGMAGDDTLSGGAGHDTLFGGDGNDSLSGNKGNDSLSGNKGNDLLFGDGDASTLDAVADAAGLEGDVTADGLAEALEGDTDGSVLESLLAAVDGSETDGNDTLEGGEGDDFLFGMGGNDTLFGNAGGDYLFGGAGNDYLDGGAGDDYLDGGAGEDSLYGGSGNDIVVYDPNDYIIDGGEGIDVLLADTNDLGSRTVDELLAGTGEGPKVSGFEIVITGNGVEDLGLTSLGKLGITVNQENSSVTLSDAWQSNGDGGFTQTVNGVDLTLETNLTPAPGGSESDAVQAQVFLLQNSQG